ncbi:unnamed protein product [Ambrosiozyma monospora]|uniref:Unnamed protein product n=1 Tax=Ambrosiozyma monospora TaxID=43982 RepID=A0ACB5SQS7_AMBMO|nr:unnamed protein product [Ambrosiozyma monospora]
MQKISNLSKLSFDTAALERAFANYHPGPRALPLRRPDDHKITLLPGFTLNDIQPLPLPKYLAKKLEFINNNITELLKLEFIREVPSCDYYARAFVTSHNNKSRMLIDYRELNRITRPLPPSIPSFIDLLVGVKGKILSTLELSQEHLPSTHDLVQIEGDNFQAFFKALKKLICKYTKNDTYPNLRFVVTDDSKALINGIKTNVDQGDQGPEIGEKENAKTQEMEKKTSLKADNKELKNQLTEYQTQATPIKRRRVTVVAIEAPEVVGEVVPIVSSDKDLIQTVGFVVEEAISPEIVIIILNSWGETAVFIWMVMI